MLDLAVISSDDAFADILCDACSGNGAVQTVDKMTIADLRASKRRNGVALLVVEDALKGINLVSRLLKGGSNWQIIGVLRDDNPKLAFELIARGADYAIAVPMHGNAPAEPSAWEMLRQLLYPLLAALESSERPMPLLKGRLTAADQVFISMHYDNVLKDSKEELDYSQAIVPALKKLGVNAALSRSRRNQHGRTTNAKLLDEIHSSRVVLVQLSSMTDYVAYEFGAADFALRIQNAHQHPIVQTLVRILEYVTLRRIRNTHQHPIVLEGIIILRPVAVSLPAVATAKLIWLPSTTVTFVGCKVNSGAVTPTGVQRAAGIGSVGSAGTSHTPPGNCQRTLR